MEATIKNIQERIIEGAKFNGVVYCANNGKRWSTLYIYLDGEYTKIDQVMQVEAKRIKKEVESYLGGMDKNNNPTTTWSVAGKKVTNSLSYAEMYNKYGMDFE